MASITFAIDESLKRRMAQFLWVNWSELAREELIKQVRAREAFERFRKLTEKSRFTEKDADELAEKVKKSMHEHLKRESRL